MPNYLSEKGENRSSMWAYQACLYLISVGAIEPDPELEFE